MIRQRLPFLALLLLCPWFLRAEDPAQNSVRPITAAALLPLSGSQAEHGLWARQGFELALEKINQKNRRINLFYEDTQNDSRKALSIYQSLTSRYSPQVIMSYGSGVGLVLSPLVNRDRIVLMAIATAADKYTSAGDFTFRNYPSAALEGASLALAVKEKAPQAALALLVVNNDYGIGLGQAFRRTFLAHGGRIVFDELYQPADLDYRVQLLRLKQSKADTVVLITMVSEGAALLRQAKELRIRAQYFASGAIRSGKNLFDLSQGAAEGLMIFSTRPPHGGPPGDPRAQFEAAFKLKYGEEVTAQNFMSPSAFDALMVIARTLEGCTAPRAECLRDELFKIEDYRGPSGTITFDQNGDISSEFGFYRVVNGGFEDL